MITLGEYKHSFAEKQLFSPFFLPKFYPHATFHGHRRVEKIMKGLRKEKDKNGLSEK